MEKLSKDIPDLKYLIAGGGPYEKELSKLIREKGLDSCVKLLGRVSEEEKDSLYRKCDYFIMPSYIVEEESSVEGFGIVFIEANMYGKYVIATRSGGIPDAIQEHVTGEFVETENADSIVETIRHLYLNDFMYDPDKCIEWAKNMDIEKIVDEYIFNISDYLGK